MQVQASAWLRGLDPPIYLVGVVPILVGGAATLRAAEPLAWHAWVLVSVAFLCIHAAVNVYNDAFDAATLADRAKAHSLARLASLPILFTVATLLLVVGCFIGIAYWARVGGWTVLWLSAAGLLLVFLYHAPPLRLSHHGLGEPVTFVGFGLLPVWTTASLADGRLPPPALAPGVLVGLAAVLVLYYHNLAHFEGDQAGGKRTMAVRLGRLRARRAGLLLSLANLAGVAAWTQDAWFAAAVVAGLAPLAFAADAAAARSGEARVWVLALYAGIGTAVMARLASG